MIWVSITISVSINTADLFMFGTIYVSKLDNWTQPDSELGSVRLN